MINDKYRTCKIQYNTIQYNSIPYHNISVINGRCTYQNEQEKNIKLFGKIDLKMMEVCNLYNIYEAESILKHY